MCYTGHLHCYIATCIAGNNEALSALPRLDEVHVIKGYNSSQFILKMFLSGEVVILHFHHWP